MGLGSAGRPNIVIVVMDTVRQKDFPGGPEGVSGMPVANRLRKESFVFPRAIAVAPWTVPSHASILTGLYPWEHGAHSKRNIQLNAAIPRLPEMLRAGGYRSFLLSSNFLISPELGFSEGFDKAAWGTWWEAYFRVQGGEPPINLTTDHAPPAVVAKPRVGPFWRMIKGTAPMFHHYPWLMDGSTRFVRHLKYPNRADDDSVSPWIEPTFRQWMAETSKEQPVFALINLLEAHEPYFPTSEVAPTFGEWWRYLQVRQDRRGWLSGEFEPSASDLQRLLTLYRQTFNTLDRRLDAIIRTLIDSGRWENTVFVLTSDHGQAFGEQGLFFHMLRVDEAEIRIPLWLRPPRGTGEGREGQGWATLVDIVPTVLEYAKLPAVDLPLAHSLASLIDASRPDPIFAAADGIISDPMLQGLADDKKAEYDRPWVAVYENDQKVVLDVDRNIVHAYDIAHDPEETRDCWPEETDLLASFAEQARNVGDQLRSGPITRASPEVEEQLRSWGYI